MEYIDASCWLARADLFRLLGDEDRLRLLALCAEEELTVGELATLLGESQPQVTKKTQPLREAGLLATRRDGTRTLLRVERRRPTPVIAAGARGGPPAVQQGRQPREGRRAWSRSARSCRGSCSMPRRPPTCRAPPPTPSSSRWAPAARAAPARPRARDRRRHRRGHAAAAAVAALRARRRRRSQRRAARPLRARASRAGACPTCACARARRGCRRSSRRSRARRRRSRRDGARARPRGRPQDAIAARDAPAPRRAVTSRSSTTSRTTTSRCASRATSGSASSRDKLRAWLEAAQLVVVTDHRSPLRRTHRCSSPSAEAIRATA